MANDEEKRVAALKLQAKKLGCQIHATADRHGYGLVRSLPGSGRQMLLGRDGGVALDAIAKKLDELEAEAAVAKGSRSKP